MASSPQAATHRAGRDRVVLFDAGGTLVLLNPAGLGDFFSRRGLRPPSVALMAEAHYRAMFEWTATLARGEANGFAWWVRHYLDDLGWPGDVPIAEESLSREVMWDYAIPGTRDAVLAVRRAGYRTGVVSNSDGTVAAALESAGLADLFEVIVDSRVVGVSKPDPGVFDVALRAMDAEPDNTWYVGDSPYHDVGGARATGLAGCILVDPLGLAPAGQLRVSGLGEVAEILAEAPPARKPHV